MVPQEAPVAPSVHTGRMSAEDHGKFFELEKELHAPTLPLREINAKPVEEKSDVKVGISNASNNEEAKQTGPLPDNFRDVHVPKKETVTPPPFFSTGQLKPIVSHEKKEEGGINPEIIKIFNEARSTVIEGKEIFSHLTKLSDIPQLLKYINGLITARVKYFQVLLDQRIASGAITFYDSHGPQNIKQQIVDSVYENASLVHSFDTSDLVSENVPVKKWNLEKILEQFKLVYKLTDPESLQSVYKNPISGGILAQAVESLSLAPGCEHIMDLITQEFSRINREKVQEYSKDFLQNNTVDFLTMPEGEKYFVTDSYLDTSTGLILVLGSDSTESLSEQRLAFYRNTKKSQIERNGLDVSSLPNKEYKPLSSFPLNYKNLLRIELAISVSGDILGFRSASSPEFDALSSVVPAPVFSKLAQSVFSESR